MRGLHPEARCAGSVPGVPASPAWPEGVSKAEGGGWEVRLAGGQGRTPWASRAMWAFRSKVKTSRCPSFGIRSRLQTGWRCDERWAKGRASPPFSRDCQWPFLSRLHRPSLPHLPVRPHFPLSPRCSVSKSTRPSPSIEKPTLPTEPFTPSSCPCSGDGTRRPGARRVPSPGPAAPSQAAQPPSPGLMPGMPERACSERRQM